MMAVMGLGRRWDRSKNVPEVIDLGDWIADRRRDSLEPGHLSAAVLESLAEDDLGPLARRAEE